MSNRINESLENKDILAEIINFSADAVVSIDNDYKIVLVNSSFEKLFGYTSEEVLGKSLDLLLPKPIHSFHKKRIEDYDKSGEAARYMGDRKELFGISKSGDKIPLDISIQKHPEGSFCRYTAICRDITSRLARERRVKEEEVKFRMLFNTSHHMTILMNGDGEVLEFNDTVSKILQIEVEKDIGRKVWDCEFWASETDFSLIEGAILNAKPDEDISLIVNAIGENNRKIILEISIKMIWAKYKNATLIILEGKDITEIRRSNKALVESEGRLARAQKMSRLGNFEWTIATNVSIWSDEVYNIFGMSSDTFEPDYESFLERVHPDDRQDVDNTIIAALKSEEMYNITHRIILPDGLEKIIETQGEIVRMKDGTPIRMEGTFQDITEGWTREQELLVAKISAEEANIAKAQFLSAISHELRTPLNAIIGFGTMIAEEQMGKLNIPSYREYAADINASGKELLELIENILNVTSFELGAIKYQPSYVAPQELLDSSLAYITERAAKKNINIETSVSMDIPEIYIDFDHTQRILIHLADNAIKFSSDNKTVKIDLYHTDDEFIIDVTDQGIGLDEKDIESIFDLFVQKDMNFNRAYGGVGLGLTIVKNLAELQDARVDVKINTGEGSCFSVFFSKVTAKPDAIPEIARMN